MLEAVSSMRSVPWLYYVGLEVCQRLVPEGYEYGDLALQVGGVSDETVKYGYGF
jgi:hypothetical protein